MNTRSFLPYARQSINDEDILAVSTALTEDLITRGPKVEEFEQAVASYCGTKYGIAFNSASSALAGAYFAAETGSFDRVITAPNSFVASVGPAIQFGAQHVFVDINRDSGNLNLEHLSHNLQIPASRGKTIITPVHFAGIAVDMEKIDRMIASYDTVVIEDAAHAIGSYYPDGVTKVGSCAWSHMTVFSFHPAKVMTTGEGGMVMTNDERLAHRLQLFRNNGIEQSPPFLEQTPSPWYYEVVSLTGNYNFTTFQAALGISQLQRLDKFINHRRSLMKTYRTELQNTPHLKMFAEEFDARTAYHLCVVQIDFKAHGTTREEVMLTLKQQGIGTQVHYIPIYRHPYFKKRGGDLAEYFPETEKYYEQALSLPLFYEMTEEEVIKVTTALKSTLARQN